MDSDLFLALAGFCFVTSITPGPNNLMLMTSGANFGMRRTLPHMLGVSLGHGAMVAILGLGLLRLFELWPWLRPLLMSVCAVYLLWLAWKFAHAAAPGGASAEGKPLSFLQAAAFQWVNPKAIYMGIAAQTYYAPKDGGWLGAGLVALVFCAINLPSVSLWAWGGTQMRRLLRSEARLRAFNWTMAALLVLSLVPAFPE